MKTDPHSSNAFISAIRGLMPGTVEMDEWCKRIAYELDNVRINFVAAAQREAHAEALARIEELEAALRPLAAIADAFDVKRGTDAHADHDQIHGWCVTAKDGTTIERSLDVGMLRAARAALGVK